MPAGEDIRGAERPNPLNGGPVEASGSKRHWRPQVAKTKAETKESAGVYTLRALDADLKPLDIGGVETEIRSIGEVLVVRVRGRVRQEQREQVAVQLREAFPDRFIVVADEGVSGFFELVAVAPAEETASAGG